MSGQRGDGGVYGYGTRSVPMVVIIIGRSVHSGAVPTTRDSQSALVLGSGVPINEGVMNRWSHVSIFTREPMYRSMWIINPVRTDSTQISTGEDHGLLLGYWANDNNMNRTFKGKISDFRVTIRCFQRMTEISSTTMTGEDLTPTILPVYWK